jgi:HK97 family phage major capsid protein
MSDVSLELQAIEKLGDQIKKFETQLGARASKEEFDQVKSKLDELNKNFGVWADKKIDESVTAIKTAMDSIKTQVEEMSEDIAIAKGNQNSGSYKSLGQMVIDKLKENKMLDRPFTKGEHRTLEIGFEVSKLAGTMTTSNVTPVGTNAIPFSLADYEFGLTRIVRRQPYLIQIANTTSTDKMYVQWAEQANPDGAAGETSEGATKNQIDFDWVEKSAKVEKITAFIKVSKEALSDLDGLRNEIDTELREQILLKVDVDLLSGDGTAPTINGLLNQDTAFAAGSFEDTVVNATKADVLRAAIAQVVANLFQPNYAILHPNDVASMDLEKGTDGHYSLPPFRSADGMMISGVRIIANTGQTVDKFTVGDFTKFNVRVREGLTIDIGLDGNDFTKNLVTILGEIRLVAYVKTNHAGAFVSGDFSDAITALDAAGS